MKAKIKTLLRRAEIEKYLNELKVKRRKKADLDKKRYHEFYSLAATPPDQWVIMQAKKKGKLPKT